MQLQTEASLYQSGICRVTAELFNNRHIRHTDNVTGESLYHTATSQSVIEAHKALLLIDTQWPSEQAALAEVYSIQAMLDRQLLK